MKSRFNAILFSGLLILIAAACSARVEAAAPAAVEDPPDEVVESFYEWYLAQDTSRLGDGSYRQGEQLSETFIQQVDELVASFDEGGYDPFLCAQDVPEWLTCGEPEIEGEKASVPVETSWGTRFEVRLALAEGDWKIADIRCR